MEPALVGRLGDEAADVRVHPPGAREEEAAVGRHRVLAAEEVLEHGGRRALGMDPLRDLPELLRVAEQDDVACACPERECVGERHLPGLVDEERVDDAFHVLACEQPGGSREQQDVFVRLREVRLVPGGRHERPLVGVALLQPAERDAFVLCGLLDLGDEVVDRLVARRGDADPPTDLIRSDDQPCAGVGLPRSGRPLDHEVPAGEAGDELLRGLEVVLR